MTISGNWVLHYAWGPTDTFSDTAIAFNTDGTFINGTTRGRWRQQDGTLLLSFDDGPAKYSGTIDGNVGSGAMVTFTGLSGCWYLTKQGTAVKPEVTDASH